MTTGFDGRKTLQELEQHDWGEPDSHSSLVQTCHRLRRVPLADFTAGELRFMIGQKIGLRFLVPLALERLHDDPLVEGNLFPGDLLKIVLAVPVEFWRAQTDMCELLGRIVARTEELLVALPDSEIRLIREDLSSAQAILREMRE